MPGSIDERPRADGSYSYRVKFYHTNKNGERQWISETFDHKYDAEEYLLGLKRKYDDGNYEPPTERTLEEAVRKYIRNNDEINDDTRETYGHYAKNIYRHPIGDRAINDVEYAQLDDFFQELYDGGDGLSNSTLSDLVSILNGVFEEALKRNEVDADPMENISAPGSNDTDQSIDDDLVMDQDQMNHFFQIVQYDDGTEDYLYPPIVFASCTGARRGETSGLTWDRVDLDNGKVALLKQITDSNTFKDVKSKSSKRTISIPPPLLKTLKSWRKRQNELRNELGEGGWNQYDKDHDIDASNNDFVFTDLTGDVILPGRLYSRVSSIGKNYEDLPTGMTFHSLRHSHASILISRGHSMFTVKKRLGHKSIQVTMDKYGHLMNGIDTEAASDFGSVVDFETDYSSIRETPSEPNS